MFFLFPVAHHARLSCSGGGGLEESEALSSDMRGDQQWREAMDPNTNMVSIGKWKLNYAIYLPCNPLRIISTI